MHSREKFSSKGAAQGTPKNIQLSAITLYTTCQKTTATHIARKDERSETGRRSARAKKKLARLKSGWMSGGTVPENFDCHFLTTLSPLRRGRGSLCPCQECPSRGCAPLTGQASCSRSPGPRVTPKRNPELKKIAPWGLPPQTDGGIG